MHLDWPPQRDLETHKGKQGSGLACNELLLDQTSVAKEVSNGRWRTAEVAVITSETEGLDTSKIVQRWVVQSQRCIRVVEATCSIA